MITVRNIDQLRSNTQSIARFADAAFEYGMNLQLPSDVADILVLSLKSKRRRTRCHSKRFDLA